MSLASTRQRILREDLAKNREISWLVFALVFLSTARSGILEMWSRRSLDFLTSRRTSRLNAPKAPSTPASQTKSKTTLPSHSASPRPLVQAFTEDVRNTFNRTKRMTQELSSNSMRLINLAAAGLAGDLIGVWLMSILLDDGV
jgi:hypothetical protein